MMYQRLPREGDDHECRVLLIGKTGSGKSSTGNLIFNDGVFGTEMSTLSVTRASQKHTGSVNNRRVTVIDTPDFIFSTHTDFDSDSKLKSALELCSLGAHVILLFLPLSTFTEQEMDFISWFEQRFGAEALRFTLVLFTHADKTHVTPLGEMIRANPQLSGFINRCGQRYHEFNIKAPANRQQVTELMEKIDRLVFENTNSCYTLEMMPETERRRETEMEETHHVKKSVNCQAKLNYFCLIICFAVATGVVLVWRKGSSHRWTIMCGFITGGSAAAAGIFIGIPWRFMWKSQFVRIFPALHNHHNIYNKLLLKMLGVVCGLTAGAAIGHFVGGSELPVTVLAGLAGATGAFAAIQ